MHRDIVWERTGALGLEHLALDIGDSGIRADGLVLIDLGGDVVRLRYAVRLDPGWRTLAADLALDRGREPRSLAIARIGEDRWTVDGTTRGDLDGCFDIDIAVTPFTNAMPIHRLGLVPGAARRIHVAYLAVPDLAVSAAEQEYARLGTDRFRYRGIGTGFEAEIATDDGGIVVDYPPIWRRRSPRR